MKHIKPKAMSKEVTLLWDTAQVHFLRPEQIAPFIGVGFKTIYNWFAGQQPFEAQRMKILEGVKKIDAALGESELERGVAVRRPNREDDPEIAEDAKFRASTRLIFYQLQEACSDAEKELVADSWVGFTEVLHLLKKHGIIKKHGVISRRGK